MITWKQLCQTVLTATAANIYQPAGAAVASIHQATLWNPTAAAVVVKFYILPSAGTAGDGNTVFSVSVGATSAVDVPQLVNHKIPNGSSLFAVGSGVTLTVSGVESA